MRTIETCLLEPGIAIPDITAPLANYIPVKKSLASPACRSIFTFPHILLQKLHKAIIILS